MRLDTALSTIFQLVVLGTDCIGNCKSNFLSTQLKYYGVFFVPITVFRNILFVKILGQISLEIESDDYYGDVL
jgi:hypothetical protein